MFVLIEVARQYGKTQDSGLVCESFESHWSVYFVAWLFHKTENHQKERR